MQCIRVGLFAVVGLLVVGAGASWGQAPVAVSPGSATGTVIGDACPTFSWTRVEGARGYELVVYRVGPGEREPEELLRGELPEGATSWTPALDRCLDRGRRYAWAVRPVLPGGPASWSEASLFEVAGAPSIREVERALATLKSYLTAERGEAPPSFDSVQAPRPSVGPPALGATPARSAPTTPSAPLAGISRLVVEAADGPDIDQAIRGTTLDGDTVQAAGVIGEALNSLVGEHGRGVIGRSHNLLGVGVEGIALGGGGTGVNGAALNGGKAVVGIAAGAGGIGGVFDGEQRGLVVSGRPCCDGTTLNDYAATIANNSTGADPDALAVWLDGTPSTRSNYIGFFDWPTPGQGNPRLTGSIRGDGRGGVEFRGTHLWLVPTDTPLVCNDSSHQGRLYFDASLKELCVCTGGTDWAQLDGGGTC